MNDQANYEHLMRRVLKDLETIESNTPQRLVRGKTYGDWIFIARSVSKKPMSEPQPQF